jgi:hypothetical protein
MFQECGEKHSPARCDTSKKLSPQQRLKMIDGRELCRLCYCHLQGRVLVPGQGAQLQCRWLRGPSLSPTAWHARGGPRHGRAGDRRQEGAGPPVPGGRESGGCRQD